MLRKHVLLCNHGFLAVGEVWILERAISTAFFIFLSTSSRYHGTGFVKPLLPRVILFLRKVFVNATPARPQHGILLARIFLPIGFDIVGGVLLSIQIKSVHAIEDG